MSGGVIAIIAGLFVLPVVGFIIQWLRWEVVPTWLDKRKDKKMQKRYKKRLTK